MALRVCLLLAMLALATVTQAVPLISDGAASQWNNADAAVFTSSGTCDGPMGECLGEEEEMMMESEISRRVLAETRSFISYGALKKDKVPCNRRGQSYYNCQKRGRTNPYRRGCTAITKCKRFTD